MWHVSGIGRLDWYNDQSMSEVSLCRHCHKNQGFQPMTSPYRNGLDFASTNELSKWDADPKATPHPHQPKEPLPSESDLHLRVQNRERLCRECNVCNDGCESEDKKKKCGQWNCPINFRPFAVRAKPSETAKKKPSVKIVGETKSELKTHISAWFTSESVCLALEKLIPNRYRIVDPVDVLFMTRNYVLKNMEHVCRAQMNDEDAGLRNYVRKFHTLRMLDVYRSMIRKLKGHNNAGPLDANLEGAKQVKAYLEQSRRERYKPAIDEFLSTLPDQDKQLIYWRFFESKTYQEIADTTNMPLATVYDRIQTIVDALGTWLVNQA